MFFFSGISTIIFSTLLACTAWIHCRISPLLSCFQQVQPSFRDSSILPLCTAVSQKYSFFHIQGHCLNISNSFGLKHRSVHFYEYSFLCLMIKLFALRGYCDFCPWTCFVPESPSRKQEATAQQQKGKDDGRNVSIRTILTHLLPGLECTFGLTVADLLWSSLSWEILTDVEDNNVFHLQWNVPKGKMPHG